MMETLLAIISGELPAWEQNLFYDAGGPLLVMIFIFALIGGVLVIGLVVAGIALLVRLRKKRLNNS